MATTLDTVQTALQSATSAAQADAIILNNLPSNFSSMIASDQQSWIETYLTWWQNNVENPSTSSLGAGTPPPPPPGGGGGSNILTDVSSVSQGAGAAMTVTNALKGPNATQTASATLSANNSLIQTNQQQINQDTQELNALGPASNDQFILGQAQIRQQLTNQITADNLENAGYIDADKDLASQMASTATGGGIAGGLKSAVPQIGLVAGDAYAADQEWNTLVSEANNPTAAGAVKSLVAVLSVFGITYAALMYIFANGSSLLATYVGAILPQWAYHFALHNPVAAALILAGIVALAAILYGIFSQAGGASNTSPTASTVNAFTGSMPSWYSSISPNTVLVLSSLAFVNAGITGVPTSGLGTFSVDPAKIVTDLNNLTSGQGGPTITTSNLSSLVYVDPNVGPNGSSVVVTFAPGAHGLYQMTTEDVSATGFLVDSNGNPIGTTPAFTPKLGSGNAVIGLNQNPAALQQLEMQNACLQLANSPNMTTLQQQAFAQNCAGPALHGGVTFVPTTTP